MLLPGPKGTNPPSSAAPSFSLEEPYRDEIGEEIHAIRRQIAAKFDNDVHRILEDARLREGRLSRGER